MVSLVCAHDFKSNLSFLISLPTERKVITAHSLVDIRAATNRMVPMDLRLPKMDRKPGLGRKRITRRKVRIDYSSRRLTGQPRFENMLCRAPLLVRQILELDEELVALPNIFQEQIEDRRRRREDAAVFNPAATADVAHLQASLNA